MTKRRKPKLKGLNVESIVRNAAHSAHRLGLIDTSRLNKELRIIEEKQKRLKYVRYKGKI